VTASDPEKYAECAEYVALRATIRERGSIRVWVFSLGTLVWAALAAAVGLLNAPPVATLTPLVALAMTFEAILALHATVERIGRYLLVFHDDEWERVAGAFGRPQGSLQVDALFGAPLIVCAIVNLEPLIVSGPTLAETAFVLAAHALFVLRVLSARSAASRQRAVDTERFQQLKREPPRPA
jgi:hypothetical protein